MWLSALVISFSLKIIRRWGRCVIHKRGDQLGQTASAGEGVKPSEAGKHRAWWFMWYFGQEILGPGNQLCLGPGKVGAVWNRLLVWQLGRGWSLKDRKDRGGAGLVRYRAVSVWDANLSAVDCHDLDQIHPKCLGGIWVELGMWSPSKRGGWDWECGFSKSGAGRLYLKLEVHSSSETSCVRARTCMREFQCRVHT